MAMQTFNDAMNSHEELTVMSPDGTEYNGYHCDPKVDRTTLPAGWYAYDIRHDDDGCGIFVELCHDYVVVNNAGTFLTQTPIPELMADHSSVDFEIDPEDWAMAHDGDSSDCPENSDTNWGYTFC